MISVGSKTCLSYYNMFFVTTREFETFDKIVAFPRNIYQEHSFGYSKCYSSLSKCFCCVKSIIYKCAMKRMQRYVNFKHPLAFSCMHYFVEIFVAKKRKICTIFRSKLIHFLLYRSHKIHPPR